MNSFSLAGIVLEKEEGEFCQFSLMLPGQKFPLPFYCKPEALSLVPDVFQECRVEGTIRVMNRGIFDKQGKAQGKIAFSLSPSKINGVAIPSKQGERSQKAAAPGDESGVPKRREVSSAA